MLRQAVQNNGSLYIHTYFHPAGSSLDSEDPYFDDQGLFSRSHRECSLVASARLVVDGLELNLSPDAIYGTPIVLSSSIKQLLSHPCQASISWPLSFLFPSLSASAHEHKRAAQICTCTAHAKVHACSRCAHHTCREQVTTRLWGRHQRVPAPAEAQSWDKPAVGGGSSALRQRLRRAGGDATRVHILLQAQHQHRARG